MARVVRHCVSGGARALRIVQLPKSRPSPRDESPGTAAWLGNRARRASVRTDNGSTDHRTAHRSEESPTKSRTAETQETRRAAVTQDGLANRKSIAA